MLGVFYCSGCGKQEGKGEESDGFKSCAKCKASYYCSGVCQKMHWEAGHRKDCKYMDINGDW